MPTQRPFLSNFLAAFRAHSTPLPKSQPSISTSGAVAASTQTIWTSSQPTSKAQSQNSSSSDISSPRPIPPQKQNAYSTAAASATAQASSHQERQYHALQHNVSPQTHLPRSPPSPGGQPVYGPPNKPQPSYPTPQESRTWADHSRKSRRGSDSSSEGGFREVKGAGWFVGGRTAQGEEKYYKLSMVKRDRSSDRISADQLSL